MPVWQALVYGVVQGLAEFLPISSSAHLTLLPWALGWTEPVAAPLNWTVTFAGRSSVTVPESCTMRSCSTAAWTVRVGAAGQSRHGTVDRRRILPLATGDSAGL